MTDHSMNMNKGLVSVVVPTCNRESYVSRTLHAVWEQSYRPIELVIVDDGSTDRTVPVVREWISRHSCDDGFSAILLEQENAGVAAARNAGYYASTGEYIHFLDSDDVPIPVMYERQVAVMDMDPECDYVWSGWHDAPDGGMDAAVEHVMATDARASEGARVPTMPYLVWPGLFRRRACTSIGDWDATLYYNEDWEYSSRFLCLEPVIRQLPNTMMIYRMHSGSERVTARATQEKANEAKLASIEKIRSRLPEAGSFRRVLATRLAMMSYSALLHATRQGYRVQRRRSRRLGISILKEHFLLIPMRWKMRMSGLCFLSTFTPSWIILGMHSSVSKVKRILGGAQGQWFQ